MEPERARELLARERARIEKALRVHSGAPLEGDASVEPGNEGDEAEHSQAQHRGQWHGNHQG